MRFLKTALLILLFVTSFSLFAQTLSQFRGPARDGIYPETKLLPAWPENGPAMLWQLDGIGNGYSSPAITSDKIFVTGEIDSTGYLFALDKKGRLLWKKEIGKEWMENFTGSRSTPTIVGDLIYLCSGMGRISCLKTADGEKLWSTEMLKDLNGINVRFGYAEGLLVNNDIVYCSPGGADTNIVALNRFTGKMIWKSKALGDTTAYCSPILINLPSRKLLVTFTIHHMIGLDASTGELLWSYKQDSDRDIQACTPLFDNGYIYYVNGSGGGAVKLKLSPDGKAIEEVWNNPAISDVHGGAVKLGNFIYTSQYRPRRYCSLDCSSGILADSLKFDKGAIIAADNRLYCYTENGKVGLVEPANGKMALISSFKMPVGKKEFFTIPVISEGILYLRHGDSILAYDIRRNQPD